MFRPALNQIGGTNAVTMWAWLITLPLSVLISSTYSTAPSLQQAASWTGALVLVHAGVGLVMLLARFTVLPGNPRQARPVTAILVFASMGFVRAVLLQVAQDVVGFGSFVISERIAFNVSISVLVFSALAIVIGESREDAQVVLRLTAARNSLDDLQRQREETLINLDKRIVSDIEQKLTLALADSSIDPDGLRRLSEDLVRAQSHELIEPGSVETPSKPSRVRAIEAILKRLQVPPPLLVLVPFQLAVFGFVAIRYSMLIAVVGSIVGPLPSFIGLWLARRFLPLPRNGWLRLGILAAVFAAIGSAATIVISQLFTAWFGEYQVSAFAVGSGLMAMSLLASIWIAVVDGRESRRNRLAEAVEEEAREIQRTSRMVNERRTMAARFLHGSIQGELIAASMRGDTASEVREHLRDLFKAYSTPLPPPTAAEAVVELLESWGQILRIEQRIDPCVWLALTENPDRESLLVDAISEGLVNVVRHSTSNEVSVSLSCEGSTAIFQLTSQGVPIQHTPGIGLVDLSARGAHVKLTSDQATTTLVVHV